MKLSTFHLGDGVRLGASIRLQDGSTHAGGWSYPYERWSYPAGEGWSWGFGEWSYPVGPGWSYPWGEWSYPGGVASYWSFPWWDEWSYMGEGWSYDEGGWSWNYVDGWSYQEHTGWSYPGGWSYGYGWSYDRTFAVEAEHIRAGQVVLTSYLSAWWLNAVVRGVDGTTAVGHGAGARLVPVSYGTLRPHPRASGFLCFHLDKDLEPWVGQIVKGYIENRRQILSFYAWVDEVGDGDGGLVLEADWGDAGLVEWDESGWDGTWDAQYDGNARRMAPDGTVSEDSGVPAGMGMYRFWVPVPVKEDGYSLRIRARATAGDFFVDRAKLEAEAPLDVGQATSAGEDWLEDEGRDWGKDEWADKEVVITSGDDAPLKKRISSNTHDRIYITGSWALSGDETYEIVGLGRDARPSAYVDEGMMAGWMQEIKAENIVGGLLTLGGETISAGVGGARMRVLDNDDETLITIGENIDGSDYRGIDLRGGSGLRIEDGSGGEIEIGDNVKITEEGYFGYNDEGARTIWLKSQGGFTLATGSEWKERLEFDDDKGLTFYDDANIPFVSFNPATTTVYLGREYQPHISITPDAVTVHGSLIIDETVTADKLSVINLQAVSANTGQLTVDDELTMGEDGVIRWQGTDAEITADNITIHGFGPSAFNSPWGGWGSCQNLFTRARVLDDPPWASDWTKSHGTGGTDPTLSIPTSPDNVGPDGLEDELIECAFGTNPSYLGQAATNPGTGLAFTLSVWVKGDTAGTIHLSIQQVSAQDEEIVVTTRWRRKNITKTVTNLVDDVTGWFKRLAGDLQTVYIWGPQLEQASAIGVYIPTDDNGPVSTRYYGLTIGGNLVLAGGHVMAVGGHFYPLFDDVYYLGHPSRRWKRFYTNNVTIWQETDSGDPSVTFKIGTLSPSKFIIGVDDDDSDKFKISGGGELGVNDRFEIDSSGATAIAGALTAGGVALSEGFLNIGTVVELTVAAGVVTATQTHHTIDTQNDDATDDLDTIDGGTDGDLLVLRSVNSARDTTIKHGTGNIYLDGSADFTLTNIRDKITLIRQGVTWQELARSNNA